MSLIADDLGDYSYGVPQLVGVYQIRTTYGGKWFRVWNGTEWQAGNNTVQGAAMSTTPCRSPDCMSDGWKVAK